MFDIGWPELFIIAVVVLLVVGPKDLPKVLRTVGRFAGKAKAITREFRGHVDDMIRESELEEVSDEINTASDMNLEDFSENTIGLEDEIRDALEFDGEEYKGDIFGDDDPEPEHLASTPRDTDETVKPAETEAAQNEAGPEETSEVREQERSTS